MSNLAFDRFVSGSNWTFDRLVDVNGTPTISSVGTVQDGAAFTITGTSFSGNTVQLSQGNTMLSVPVASEGTTSITTAALDASAFFLTQPATVTVLNGSGVASNSYTVNIQPATGWKAQAVNQQFLGDISSRLTGVQTDLAYGYEYLVGNVQGGTISDINDTGQGTFDVASAVTAFDLVIMDGTRRGVAATQTLASPVSTVAVPSVSGETQAQATTDITALGLVASVVASVPSNTVAEGSVTNQFPAATTLVSPGSTVEITISLGSTVALVPNLLGLSQADALAALTAAGLTGTTRRVIDGNNTGLVVNQSEDPGQPVALGTAIKIAISSNQMPNIVGQLQQNGSALVSAAGLTLVQPFPTTSSSMFAPGYVALQSPLPDAVVSPGDNVTLTLSVGRGGFGSERPQIRLGMSLP